MKTLFLVIPLLLIGCAEVYRYPCQDPANAENPECNRPICEADGMCYDTLNGLPPKQSPAPQVEEVPAAPVAESETIEDESTGE